MKKTITLLTLIGSVFTLLPGNAQTISTFAGTGTAGLSGNGGPATAAKINAPQNITIDAAGNVYIADWANNCVRKVDNTGTITIVAGTGAVGYSGDGGPATAAKMFRPAAVCFDASNNMYIAEEGDCVVRKVTSSGIISTFAGMAYQPGYTGNGGPATAAELYSPADVKCDASGNLYVAEADNNIIRKVDASGKITPFAGNAYMHGTVNGGYSGDGGPATSAELYKPAGMSFDASGNLFFCDTYNNVIRKVSTTGVITTIAGNHSAGYSGDGGPATAAEFHYPEYLTINPYGFLFISDGNNSVVREIDGSGNISTQVGDGTAGYSGDGGLATAAELNQPRGVAFDGSSNLYVAEWNNNTVRQVTAPVSVNEIKLIPDLAIYPNPGNGMITLKSNNIKTLSIVKVYNLLGNEIYNGIISPGFAQLNLTGKAKGIYICELFTLNGNLITSKRLVIE